MEPIFPFALALSIGFTHAFEVDHLVAVSSIVTRCNSFWQALKDGLYRGLGHSSTSLVVGSHFIADRFALRQYRLAGRNVLIIASSHFCIGLGINILYQNVAGG